MFLRKRKDKKGTDVICFKNNLNKFNAQEFSSEHDRKQGELTIITKPMRWCSDLKLGPLFIEKKNAFHLKPY